MRKLWEATEARTFKRADRAEKKKKKSSYVTVLNCDVFKLRITVK